MCSNIYCNTYTSNNAIGNLNLNNYILKQVHMFKYLGIIIDNKLNFKSLESLQNTLFKILYSIKKINVSTNFLIFLVC